MNPARLKHGKMTFFYPSHTRSTLFLTLICVSLVAAGDSGDEFSNNLFSDLAPLLTLFGEQVAKQFLGQSMGWADNLIFSMAPLGIYSFGAPNPIRRH